MNDSPRTAGRICVVGAGGMLGVDLLAVLGDRGTGLTKDTLDITDRSRVMQTIRDVHPQVVVNCAAFTKVDDCETESDIAFAVNADGAGNVAAAAAAVQARCIHISTDYVYAGGATVPIREDAATGPASVYGQSKLAGEEAVRVNHAAPLIVRTAWLFGHAGPNFIETILRLAQDRPRLTIVNDQRGTPTATSDLAHALAFLADTTTTGVLHCTNSGACTWFDFAKFILEQSGGTHVEVAPISSEAFGRPAPRPAYSVLDCSHYAAIAGAPLRPWQDAVQDYLQDRAEPFSGKGVSA